MKVLASLAGGLAGAITVTLLHEAFRNVDSSAPRLDKLGERATQKLSALAGSTAPEGNKLYAGSMAGSVLANTLTYSLAGITGKRPFSAGTLLGAMMGWGAVKLPPKMGLNSEYSAGTTKKKWTTMALYVVGGLVASAVTRSLKKRDLARKIKDKVSPYKTPDESYKPVRDILV